MIRILSQKGSFLYGQALLERFLSGDSELSSTRSAHNTSEKYFPLVTVCDVKIKELETAEQSFHLYNFSCVLPINLFNEKIFMILWLWQVFVLLPVSVYQLFKWLNKIGFRQSHYKHSFVSTRLAPFVAAPRNQQLNRNTEFLMHLFSGFYVHADDVFLMRLVEYNSSLVVSTDVLNELWSQFNSCLNDQD